jgi:hypothetical protein
MGVRSAHSTLGALRPRQVGLHVRAKGTTAEGPLP